MSSKSSYIIRSNLPTGKTILRIGRQAFAISLTKHLRSTLALHLYLHFHRSIVLAYILNVTIENYLTGLNLINCYRAVVFNLYARTVFALKHLYSGTILRAIGVTTCREAEHGYGSK